MITATDTPQAEIHLVALCLDCKRRHEIKASPATWLDRLAEWQWKHPGHRIEFRSPQRELKRGIDDRRYEEIGQAPWWLEHGDFTPNADIKIEYASSAAFTITLTSLATSATFITGREGTAVSNTTNKYLDYLIGGKITTDGSSPTAGEIRIYGYGRVADSVYPDGLDGTDDANGNSRTSAEILNAALPLLSSTATDTTAGRVYWFQPVSLAAAFGNLVPKDFGLYVAHNTVANLNSTGSNHALYYTGIYATA